MTLDNRRLAVRAELAKAATALTAARKLQEAGLADDATNRAYYAAYHALCALLLTEGVEVSGHRSLPRLLGLHFVSTGRLPADVVTAASRLLSYRSLADYERTWHASEELIQNAITDADAVLREVEARLPSEFRG